MTETIVPWLAYNRHPGTSQVVKNPPANGGDVRDMGSIPGLGRAPGGGHDKPLQYSCLENPKDRGAWQVRVHRVTKSQTQLKRLSMHTQRVNEVGSCLPIDRLSTLGQAILS